MNEALRQGATVIANALPVYRCYAGHRTAQYLASDMRNPGNRTWDFTRRVVFDAGTDKLDGLLARYAGPTRLGGYLDQLADKVWFLTIARQLVANEEIKPDAFHVPLARDIGLTAVRPVAQYLGLNSDARTSGKLKMVSQVGAVLTACSPIAYHHPQLVEAMFDVAAGASAVSGVETLLGYGAQITEQYGNVKNPVAKLVVATTSEVVHLAEAA